ncbi:MAG: hypothetical protein QXR65_07680, partial [Candidatus Bathyarchaeia archaeon]
KKERENEIGNAISEVEKKLQGVDMERISRLEKGRTLIWPYITGAVICFLLAFASFAMNTSTLYVFVPIILGILLLLLVGRQVSTESRMRQALSDLKRLGDLQRDHSTVKYQVDTLMNEISEKERDVMGICQGIKRYQEIFNEYRSSDPETVVKAMEKSLQRDKQEKNSLEERKKNLEAQLGRKPDIISKIREIENELNALQSELQKIEFPKLPEGVIFSKDLLEQTRKRKVDLGNDLTRDETLLGENQSKAKELTRFVEENKDLSTKLEKQTEEVERLERRLKLVRISIEALDKTAESLRNRVHPNVEQYMGIILPEITNGRYKAVQIDENYNLRVWDPDAGEFKLREVFSGGTEDQFLLSMRLAFALALLPEVKGMHPEFLFLDEPLASSDEERREGIIQLLKELSSRFKQIFVISHIAGLETDVQNVIRMENGRVVGP